MGSDKFKDEKIAKEGYAAGFRKISKSANPYTGDDEQEARWLRNWERGAAGLDFNEYE